MQPLYFRYQTDAHGRVVLPGLSPDETLEFEMLANQVDDFRAHPQHLRLEELCNKHRSFVAKRDMPEAADVFAGYPSLSPGLVENDSQPATDVAGSPSCTQLEFAFDPNGSDTDRGHDPLIFEQLA